MNSSYLCDIGDGQNLSENLSTFSAHITNVLEVLREAIFLVTTHYPEIKEYVMKTEGLIKRHEMERKYTDVVIELEK